MFVKNKVTKKWSAEDAQTQRKNETSYPRSTPLPLHLPEEFEHHDAQIAGLKMLYVCEGSSPPLILWHGWLGFWWDWRYVITPLVKHFDAIVPDFRGADNTGKTEMLKDILTSKVLVQSSSVKSI